MKSGWVKAKLGDLCEIKHGFAFKSEFFETNGELVLLTPGNFYETGGYRDRGEKQKYYKGEFPSAFLLSKGDLLVAMTEQAEGLLGSPAIVPESNRFLHNQRLGLVTPLNGSVWDTKFFFHLFNTPQVRNAIQKTASGVKVRHTSPNKIGEISISLPNALPEQRRIVGILDEAFASIAAAKAHTEQNRQNARALFESHLDGIFSSRLRHFPEIGLGELCKFASGGTPSKSNAGYWEGNVPWVSGRDMKGTQITDTHLHISESAVGKSATRMAPKGTLLMLVRGMGLAHGAQVAELMNSCAFNQDIRSLQFPKNVVPRFLVFALRNRINASDTVLTNAAHGTLKIDPVELKKLTIPVPNRGEQQAIVERIDKLEAETQALEALYARKLAALDELKQSLLHQAFSGQL